LAQLGERRIRVGEERRVGGVEQRHRGIVARVRALTPGSRLAYERRIGSPSNERAIVGVVANPASGRDIRRLVTGASVFDNAEKANMVLRLMTGLGAAGVERVLMMPAAGVSATLHRQLRGRTGELAKQPLPELEVIDIQTRG